MTKKMYKLELNCDMFSFFMTRSLRKVDGDSVSLELYLPADFVKDYSFLVDNTDIEWNIQLVRNFQSWTGGFFTPYDNTNGHFVYNCRAFLLNVKGAYYFKLPSEFVDRYLKAESNLGREELPPSVWNWWITLSTVDTSFVDSALVNYTKGR